MKLVADKKKRTKQFDLTTMKAACENAGSSLDAKDWIVVNHIRNGGEGSANDDALRKELGFKKPKRKDGYHTSVDRRLRTVATSRYRGCQDHRDSDPTTSCPKRARKRQGGNPETR
jgi:hypothetical protein